MDKTFVLVGQSYVNLAHVAVIHHGFRMVNNHMEREEGHCVIELVTGTRIEVIDTATYNKIYEFLLQAVI